MNESIVFIRTTKGENEASSLVAHLSNDIKRALMMVDGRSSVEEIRKRASPSLRSMLNSMFDDLLKNGYIQDRSTLGSAAAIESGSEDAPMDLDFTLSFIAPVQNGYDPAVTTDFNALFENRLNENNAQLTTKVEHTVDKPQTCQPADSVAHTLCEADDGLTAAQVKIEKLVSEKQMHDEKARIAESNLNVAKARARELAHEEELEAARRQAIETARLQAKREAERERAARQAARELAKAEYAKVRAAQEDRLKAELAKAQADVDTAKSQVKAIAEEYNRVTTEAARAEVWAHAGEQERLKLAELAVAHALETVRIKADNHVRELQEAKRRSEQYAAQVKATSAAHTAAESAAIESQRNAEKEVLRIREEIERTTLEAHAREEAERIAQAKTNVQESARIAALMADQLQVAEWNKLVKTGEDSNKRTIWSTAGGGQVILPSYENMGDNNGVPVVERKVVMAAVVFFEIAEYDKLSKNKQIELKQQFKQIVIDSLEVQDSGKRESGERIFVETTDGAAIVFLQHPMYAIKLPMHFCETLIAGQATKYPELHVRIGIHLGSVSLIKDMNGQINMMGDGLDSAQHVMRFAGSNQIYVSHSYSDFVLSLSDKYDDLLHYRGAQQDKYGHDLDVYELQIPGAPLTGSSVNSFKS
jgi:hypothetical protein